MTHDRARPCGHGHGTAMATATSHATAATDKKRVLIAACLTGGFMVAEALGGLLTGSLALLADAGHMLDRFDLAGARLVRLPPCRPAGDGAPHLRLRPREDAGRLHQRPRHLRHRAVDRLRGLAALHRPGAGARRADAGGRVASACWSTSPASCVLHGGDRESLNMRGAILHVLGDLLGSVGGDRRGAGHHRHRLDADRPDPVGAGRGAHPVDGLVADARRRASAARRRAGRRSTATRIAARHRGQCRGRARGAPHACVVARRHPEHGDAARLPRPTAPTPTARSRKIKARLARRARHRRTRPSSRNMARAPTTATMAIDHAS